MMSFEAGDLIIVDYPHVETNILKRRPALVISARPLGPDGLVLWAAMITSAANRSWPGDFAIADHHEVGLPIPSVVRAEKLATVASAGAEKLSRLSVEQFVEVQLRVADYLGISLSEA
jgi:mRNA interferase MazF